MHEIQLPKHPTCRFRLVIYVLGIDSLDIDSGSAVACHRPAQLRSCSNFQNVYFIRHMFLVGLLPSPRRGSASWQNSMESTSTGNRGPLCAIYMAGRGGGTHLLIAFAI